MRKILVMSFFLLAANSSWAVSVIESGECGQGCAYTIDDEGNLKITGDGTGMIREGAFRGKRNFKNVDIQGISSVGWLSFYDAGSGGGTVKMDGSVSSISGPFWGNAKFSTIDIDSTNFSTDCRDFNLNNITLIIPPNEKKFTATAFTDSGGGSIINNLTIICKGDVALCAKSMDNALRPLINNNKTLNMSDEAGNYVSFNEKGFSVLDSTDKIKASYDKSGNLLLRYEHDLDKSVKIYDKNGKLVDIRGKRIFTVEEATALVSGKNTFAIRYR